MEWLWKWYSWFGFYDWNCNNKHLYVEDPTNASKINFEYCHGHSTLFIVYIAIAILIILGIIIVKNSEDNCDNIGKDFGSSLALFSWLVAPISIWIFLILIFLGLFYLFIEWIVYPIFKYTIYYFIRYAIWPIIIFIRNSIYGKLPSNFIKNEGPYK